MSKLTIFTLLLCFAMGMGLIGCAQFDRVAIEKSRVYATEEEQVNYLLSEANTLIKMERFDSAINIAEYILQNLDSESAEANEIIKIAMAGIEEAAFFLTINPYYYVKGRNDNVRYKWWEFGPGRCR